MNKRSLGALIALNVALLVALIAVLWSPQPAAAQGLGGSTYLMVAGENPYAGRQSVVLYVVEVNSGRVAAIKYNGSNDDIELPILTHNIADDLGAARNQR